VGGGLRWIGIWWLWSPPMRSCDVCEKQKSSGQLSVWCFIVGVKSKEKAWSTKDGKKFFSF
jgi:hypothetical protein